MIASSILSITPPSLKYGIIPELKNELLKEEELYAEQQEAKAELFLDGDTTDATTTTTTTTGTGKTRLLRDTVTEEDIAMIISQWTKIPVNKLLSGEAEKLLNLQSDLDRRVIGQDEATRVVAEAIQRSRAGMSDPTKPISTLAFLGPTGVGKTELCKALSMNLFDTEENMIRIRNKRKRKNEKCNFISSYFIIISLRR